MIIYKGKDDLIDHTMKFLGVDPIYGLTFLLIMTFPIAWRKSLYVFSKKNLTPLEKQVKGYIISQIVWSVVLLILCILHFFKFF